MTPLFVLGLLGAFASLIWGQRHPRKRGQPFGRDRIVMMLVALGSAGLMVLNFLVHLTR
jgi:hypothetical protein